MENYAIQELQNEIIRFKNDGFAHQYVKDLKDAVSKILEGVQIEISPEVIGLLKKLSTRIDNGIRQADSPAEYWIKRQSKRLSQVNQSIIALK